MGLSVGASARRQVHHVAFQRHRGVAVALADKIASLRQALVTHSAISDRKLRHYTVMLQLALSAGLLLASRAAAAEGPKVAIPAARVARNNSSSTNSIDP